MSATSVDRLDLAAVVAPMSVEEFVAACWERRPVHLRGDPERFSALFSSAEFARAVSGRSADEISVRLSLDSVRDEGNVDAHREIEVGDIARCYEEGGSICVDPIDNVHPGLRELALRLRRQLGHLGHVSVKSYLSSDGYGFNRHFDAGVVTSLQIEGRKRWRFSSRPAVVSPTNAGFMSDGEARYIGRAPATLADWERDVWVGDPADDIEVVMEPGDVLCLPTGTWHEAKAIGGSLAVNLSFRPHDTWGLLRHRIDAWATADAVLRSGVQATGADPAARKAQLREQLQRLAAFVASLGDDESDVWDELDREAEEAPAPRVPRVGALRTRVEGDVAVASESARPRVASGVATAGPLNGGMNAVLAVSDVATAAAWYESTLGLSLATLIPEFGWAQLATAVAGVQVGLSEVHGTPGESGALLNLGVDDIDEARARLEAQGVVFEGPTRTITGIVRLAAFSDPDGNRLMLYETLDRP